MLGIARETTTSLQSELRCALPVTARLDKPPRAPTRGSRGAGAKPSRRSAEPRRAEGDMRDCLTVRRGFASAIGPRFIKRSTWLTRGRTVASQCMSVLTPRMNDRSAIPAGIWRELRLIDCWTLKAAKKNTTRPCVFNSFRTFALPYRRFLQRLHRDTMKIAPAAASAAQADSR